MALEVGSQIAHYDVIALIGEGGMGQVYQAIDTKLTRQVALKILPEAFASDPDRLARFEREAQVLASLNHPGIAGIYGLEEQDGTKALVLELVEGPTLADRIAQGPIPVDEALPIAKQIAEALEAAHEQGIIHRDLKPANIKLRPDATVKVLDFGLAKALDTAPAGDPNQSPTLTAAATQMGVIMGTAAYMSPEQARGKPVDKRADIWAFGAVLFEMLTGQRAFEGDDITLTLAEVVKSDPAWTRLPPETPPSLVIVLQRCLEKDPRQRLRDIGDMRLALHGAFDTSVASPARAVSQPGAAWQRPWVFALGALLSAIVAGAGVWTVSRPDVDTAAPVRFTLRTPASMPFGFGGTEKNLAMSPDGTVIVYDGRPADASVPQLNARFLHEREAVPLRGAERGYNPAISPDGGWVSFIRAGEQQVLYKVSTAGGAAARVTQLDTGISGGAWTSDGRIVFSGVGAGLFVVPADGGQAEQLTAVDEARGEIDHLWPSLVYGHDMVVFVINGGSDSAAPQDTLAIVDLSSKEVTPLGLAGVSPQYVETGHLVYAARDATVWAVPFDPTSARILESPVRLLEEVSVKGTGAANFALSRDGRMIYAEGPVGLEEQRTLVWVDRQGNETTLAADPREYESPRISPDGRYVALEVGSDSDTDIVVYDLERDTPTQITLGAAANGSPNWTPDGERLIFRSARDGVANVYSRAADGSGEAEPLTRGSTTISPSAISPDGETIVVVEPADSLARIGAVPMSGSDEPTPLLESGVYPSVSPDGRWIAYFSDESGQFEVYVRPFPNVGDGRWQISRDGGFSPAWSRSGDELFYRGLTGSMIAVSYQAETVFRPGVQEELFQGPYLSAVQGRPARPFDVGPDGRFLMIERPGQQAPDAPGIDINVVLSWQNELLERVPVP